MNNLGHLLTKIILRAFLIMGCIVMIYLMVDFGSTSKEILGVYMNLQTDSKSDFSKSMQFLRTYTQATGDLTLALNTGMSPSDAEDLFYNPETPGGPGGGGTPDQDPGSGGGGGGGGTPNPPANPQLGAEYLNVASAVASSFVNSSGNYVYGQKAARAASYNGKTQLSDHCDCSCLVSIFLYFSGLNGSNYIHYSSATLYNGSYGTKIYQANGTSGTTFSSIQPGDVFVCSGHTAVVVNKDSDYVYFADCGSVDGVRNTATRGWHQKFALTDDIGKWRNKPLKVFRR